MVNIKGWLVYKILREIKNWFIKTFLYPFINLTRNIKNITKEHFSEKKLDIETIGDSLVNVDITTYKDSTRYSPTPYDIIEKILTHLQLGPDDVFVDIGCGKGRVIFSVGTQRLKKVIGVEAREDMFEIAMQNLKNVKVKNTPVKIVNVDVTNFDMKEGTVFFMYAPFGKETSAKVISNIKDSLAVNPRKIRIVCYEGPDLNKFEVHDWLTHEGKIANNRVNTWRTKA